MAEGPYYFWDKQLNKLASLYVLQRYTEHFVFTYNGKTYKCRYAQAAGKLYGRKTNVPEYREELRKMHEEQAEKSRRAIEEQERQIREQIEANKSCENCWLRKSGRCTQLGNQLCGDYVPGYSAPPEHQQPRDKSKQVYYER